MSPKTLKRWPRTLLVIILLICLTIALSWGYWATSGHRFTTITPDRVYQSAVIPAEDLPATVRDKKLKAVIDLRTNESTDFPPQEEGRLLEKLGVRYYHLPSKQVPEEETVAAFLKIAADPDNYPMLIHCHHGEGRSVLFAAIYRIEFEGWNNEKARKATRLLHFRGTFGPDGEKGAFLRAYAPRLTAAKAPPEPPTTSANDSDRWKEQ
ncbi:MAG: fused DSP-PTPase phosphatase/NAD kinase-like protein [Thermodesulfobacteriota bacterium]